MRGDTGDRLAEQIEFLMEADRLKGVMRRSYVLDGQRHENSAEHCWHVALVAMVLCEHAGEPVDSGRVARMMVVHDLVEIDAGDTFLYDEAGRADQAAQEQKAAERIFGMLPDGQGAELHELWQEYETGGTPEARMARAVDRLMPLLHNYYTRGQAWREHGVTRRQVLQANRHIAEGSERLWQFAQSLIDLAVQNGYLEE
jgi:putative hydrolase of HD superfamily